MNSGLACRDISVHGVSIINLPLRMDRQSKLSTLVHTNLKVDRKEMQHSMIVKRTGLVVIR